MTDKEIKQQVENALDWEPSLDAAHIGVAVVEGVVTLRGAVGSFSEKIAAERVALKVHGVKAVAGDLVVHLPRASEQTDTEIAQAAVASLKWNGMAPGDRVAVTVSNGLVTLSGALDWTYRKNAAGRLVRDLRGVKGIANNITIKPQVETTDIREKIEAAFKRSAEDRL